MLLRLASTAFKNVSFSLDETGKLGSQIWMRVSLLGTVWLGCFPDYDQKEVIKGEKLFLLKLPIISCGSQTRKEINFGIRLLFFSFQANTKVCSLVCFLKSKIIHLHPHIGAMLKLSTFFCFQKNKKEGIRWSFNPGSVQTILPM